MKGHNMKSKSSGGSLAMLIGSPSKMNSYEDDSEDMSEEEDEEVEGPSDEEVLAAEDVLSALRSKDSEELAVALSDFVKACMSDKE
jgi:hypothetical protein